MGSKDKVCVSCKKKKDSVEERRQNTRYANDSLNYVVMCDECFIDNEEYWKGMWEQTYGI